MFTYRYFIVSPEHPEGREISISEYQFAMNMTMPDGWHLDRRESADLRVGDLVYIKGPAKLDVADASPMDI